MRGKFLSLIVSVATVFVFFGVSCGADDDESSSSWICGEPIESSSCEISGGEDSSLSDGSSSASEGYQTVEAKALFPWIETLTAENVTSLKQQYGGSGVPGAIATVKTSTDENEIENMLTYLNGLTFTEISESEGQLEGGSNTYLTITTAENTYTLREYSKILSLDGQYYRYSAYIPKFTTGETAYCFAELYGEALLLVDGTEKKNYGDLAEKLLFVEKEDLTGFTYTGYNLEIAGITLLISDAKTFGVLRREDDTVTTAYTIVGETDFSQIFADYPLSA